MTNLIFKFPHGLSAECELDMVLIDQVYEGRPIYKIVDGIVTGVAITPEPAHGILNVINEKERTMSGILLSPDVLIYRSDGDYYVYFTAESIKKIRDNTPIENLNKINYNHNKN